MNPGHGDYLPDYCIRGQLQTLLTDFGYVTMDGSDPDCEWGNDPDTAPGIFGYDNLPTLDTREYGANANDSYWLANPRRLLEGYSYLIGEERVEQNLRPRQTFVQAEQRLAGTDGLGEPGFNIDNIRELLYGARNLTAELIVDDVIAICTGVEDWSAYSDQGDTVAEACGVLADWDKRYLVDSVGAQIFYEFWAAFRATEDIWAVPFDPADPVYTPRQLNTANDRKYAGRGCSSKQVATGRARSGLDEISHFEVEPGQRVEPHRCRHQAHLAYAEALEDL